jgi:hypothetical protein
MNDLKRTIDMVRSVSYNSRIKRNRSYSDFLADKIMQSSAEQTLLSCMEKLAKLMDSDPGKIHSMDVKGFVSAASGENSQSILDWLRSYPRIAAMLCMLKLEDYAEVIETIEVKKTENAGVAIKDVAHDINITINCLSPMAHGSDQKAGNATLFRRMQVLTDTGNVISLPFYAGNAFRGQMRDLLADDFLKLLGLTPRKDKPPIAMWFFYALYSGGALEDGGEAEKALKNVLGAAGAANSDGIYQFRNTIPNLSLLGCALGNRILNGRAKFGDFRPSCKQWNNGTVDVGELFEWLYLTRREDHEDHSDHHGMIANTETLRSGTVMYGGIDVDIHSTPLEHSALGRGIELIKQVGYIGADNRRGIGRIELSVEGAPSSAEYVEYVTSNKEKILEYLDSIGATLCTQ